MILSRSMSIHTSDISKELTLLSNAKLRGWRKSNFLESWSTTIEFLEHDQLHSVWWIYTYCLRMDFHAQDKSGVHCFTIMEALSTIINCTLHAVINHWLYSTEPRREITLWTFQWSTTYTIIIRMTYWCQICIMPAPLDDNIMCVQLEQYT